MRSTEPDDMQNINVGTMLTEIQPDMEIYVAHYYAEQIAAIAPVLISNSKASSGLEPGGAHYEARLNTYNSHLKTYIDHFPEISKLYPPPHLDTLIMKHMLSDTHGTPMHPAEVMDLPPRP
jgi:hypothetical protein